MGRKLYVGNLPYSATESDLSGKFAASGTVESCKLITDRDTGQSKGFGFIAGEDGKEYFVHKSALGEGVTINEGDDVTFDVVEGDRGPKADKVALEKSE